ncbi:methionine aminopeptidase, partial [Yersinia enterocolitica]|nr:methionine aminopeptidase [Yersinia enterocolitica]
LSPQSLTCVSSLGLTQLPPSCNWNYPGYKTL